MNTLSERQYKELLKVTRELVSILLDSSLPEENLEIHTQLEKYYKIRSKHIQELSVRTMGPK